MQVWSVSRRDGMDFLKKSKGLFKQKVDPAFLERQARARAGLLKNLSRAVKESQLLFTRSEKGVINDCRAVQRLCARFEEVLRHGLKGGWFGGVSQKSPTFWPVVTKISRKEAIDYINHLQYAQSEEGKCRAWIRLAVNECSLESYIGVLCSDASLLGSFYDPHGFLRDEEMTTALKQLLIGLSQIAFNITVDTASLEFSPAPEALQPALKLRAPLPAQKHSEQLLDVPSASSTPQPSSSGDSWLSTSSESFTSTDSGSNTAPNTHSLNEEEEEEIEEEIEDVKVVEKRKIKEEEEVIMEQQEIEQEESNVDNELIDETAVQPTPGREEKMSKEESMNCEPVTLQDIAPDNEDVDDEAKEEVKNALDDFSPNEFSSSGVDQDEPVIEQQSRPVSHEEMTFSEILRLAQGVSNEPVAPSSPSPPPSPSPQPSLPPSPSPPPSPPSPSPPIKMSNTDSFLPRDSPPLSPSPKPSPPPSSPPSHFPSTNPFLLEDFVTSSAPTDICDNNPFITSTNPFSASPSTNPFLVNPFDEEEPNKPPLDSNTEETKQEDVKVESKVVARKTQENKRAQKASTMFLTSEDYVLLNLPTIEDHFPRELTIENAEEHIQRLKNDIREQSDNERLKETLIKLQLLLLEMKELQEIHSVGIEDVSGHRFQQLNKLRAGKCDTCSKSLLFRVCVQCTECSYTSHRKCLGYVTRPCLTKVLKDSPNYCMDVCPERGLTQQHFRCGSCNRAFNQHPTTEVRLCDYTGLYHCSRCHSNELAVVPARVLRNWDLAMRRVCCNCSKVLDSLRTRPLISIEKINPNLYTHVSDLTRIEALRSNLIIMKPILAACTRAKEEKLLQELDNWPHFKDSANLFSLSDLMEVHTGKLLPQLQAVHQLFQSHIHNECEMCLGRGHTCAMCDSPDVLFPFDDNISSCQHCSAVFHKECHVTTSRCPHCLPQETISIRLSQI